TLFVFRNRRGTAIKCLVYDSQGFWLAQKRLTPRRFRWWPTSATAAATLEAHQLQPLIVGGDPAARDAAPVWRRLRTGQQRPLRSTPRFVTVSGCGGPSVPRPDHHADRPRHLARAHRCEPGHEPTGVVGGSVRRVALDATQRHALRGDLPWPALVAASRRPPGVAAA